MHTINWFEIPTAQLGRAAEFYAAITGLELKVTDYGGRPMVVFPGDADDVRGCLIRDERTQPGAGTRIYLNSRALAGGLAAVLARVPKAGGEVVLPKTAIGEHGWIGLFQDTEGNVVGLHEA